MESKVSSRLKQALAPEVIQYVFLPRLTREFHANFELLNQINQAHLLMLHAQGILEPGKAQPLARALLQMQAQGPDVIELDAAREEAYFNYEAHLIKLVGPDLGGRLHTARSRNDMGATIDRIKARDYILHLGQVLSKLIAAALAQATAHTGSVMPGYTHMQAAQPITFGYYLSALADAWMRDLDRLLHAMDSADGSPLGSCALAGTSFAIDRSQTSAWLGFSQPLANALDGVASRDFALELSAALSIMMVTCSRLVQDFYIWSTPEFGLLTFPDRVASTSSIMPQKKNPAVLEYLRGKTGHLIGLTGAALSTVKSTHFTHSGDSSRESTRTCWEACEEALRCLALMELVVREAQPKTAHMAAHAAEDFSTVTDLADLLVRDADISFRDAHHIIGAVVRQALEQGLAAHQISSAMIHDAALEQLGRSIMLPEAQLRGCLDPVRNVNARRSGGGPAPELVAARLAEQDQALQTRRLSLEHTVQRVARAQKQLRQGMDELLAQTH
ncbi:argininosuccinate lyase [Bordetella holmesii]|uniref:argininosuccinate lyase n=1 Tax=Bordetella holmesii TaxID=35814 RepID=UPI000C781899|nr:argininosuccinate lyase [Bordetella holmesii]AUL18895.1 argininosuccinate lyase [Bordetella holmesii]